MTTPGPARLLIAVADDDAAQRDLLEQALRAAGYDAVLCRNGQEALAAVPRASLLLLDVKMPGMSGLEVLEAVRRTRPDLPVILLTAYIDVRDAVRAIKLGAVDYLEKPLDLDEIAAAVDDALGHGGRAVPQAGGVVLPPGIVAESAAMKRVFELGLRVAPSDATVLLLGRSGSGKEVLASFIHARSPRAGNPLVRVDCGALPRDLIESELFGHEKGAFTGAGSMRRGQVELAHGGTLFLDEIGELPHDVQPKFLRVLEAGSLRRVGGSEEIKVDVRVLAATNRDLDEAVKKGEFREDLFFRLNVFPLVIPPLADRPSDILPLAERFLAGTKKRLSPAAENLLMAHDWPGNVRELRNVLERAAILADGSLILPTDMPPHLRTAARPKPAAGTLDDIERKAILDALEATGGNKTRAAALLGISRRNLIYKLRSYGM